MLKKKAAPLRLSMQNMHWILLMLNVSALM